MKWLDIFTIVQLVNAIAEMVIDSSQAKDMENIEERGEAKPVEKEIEHVSAVDLLAQYSEEEKSKALRRLDWNLIPLYVSYLNRSLPLDETDLL